MLSSLLAGEHWLQGILMEQVGCSYVFNDEMAR